MFPNPYLCSIDQGMSGHVGSLSAGLWLYA
jgi:hypothetical protein